MKKSILPILLAAALLAGCAHHGYVPPEKIRRVKHPDKANLSDFKLAVDELVQSLQDDDAYRESYDEFRAARNGLPVLMVGDFANDTGERVTPYLQTSRSRIRTRLRKGKLFKIVDDASSSESVSKKIADALLANANAGLKKAENLQSFGEQLDADYYLLGVYRQVEGEGVYSYLLELQLWNFATGEMEWSETAEISKE